MKSISKLSTTLLILFIYKTNACSNDECLTFCTYGYVVVNGCKICKCINPCEAVQCPQRKVCVPNPYHCSSEGRCLSKPKCVAICPEIECLSCPYGYKVDRNGCQTCQCADPCKLHKCQNNERCIIEHVSCRGNSCSGYKPICTKICKKLNCPTLKCPYGYQEDCNNCPICKCKNLCSDVICPPHYYCTVQTILCLIRPCPPPFPVCQNYCNHDNLLLDDYGFPVTCSSQHCPKGYNCIFVPTANQSFCCSIPLE